MGQEVIDRLPQETGHTRRLGLFRDQLRALSFSEVGPAKLIHHRSNLRHVAKRRVQRVAWLVCRSLRMYGQDRLLKLAWPCGHVVGVAVTGVPELTAPAVDDVPGDESLHDERPLRAELRNLLRREHDHL